MAGKWFQGIIYQGVNGEGTQKHWFQGIPFQYISNPYSNFALVPVNATVTASAPSPPFYQTHAVVPINAYVKSGADDAVIIQTHVFVPINAYIKAGADPAVMSQIHVVSPNDAYILVTGIGESLFQSQFVVPINAYIKVAADDAVAYQTHIFTPANATDFFSSSVTDFFQIHSIVPSGAYIKATDSTFLVTVTGGALTITLLPSNALIYVLDNFSGFSVVDLTQKINTAHARSRSREQVLGNPRITDDAPVHHSRKGDKPWQKSARRLS
jgi:hypothetical protein